MKRIVVNSRLWKVCFFAIFLLFYQLSLAQDCTVDNLKKYKAEVSPYLGYSLYGQFLIQQQRSFNGQTFTLPMIESPSKVISNQVSDFQLGESGRYLKDFYVEFKFSLENIQFSPVLVHPNKGSNNFEFYNQQKPMRFYFIDEPKSITSLYGEPFDLQSTCVYFLRLDTPRGYQTDFFKTTETYLLDDRRSIAALDSQMEMITYANILSAKYFEFAWIVPKSIFKVEEKSPIAGKK